MSLNKKVLCVDDSAFMRRIIIEILNDMGIASIIEASDGNEAIEKYKKEKPDLILLDLIMPEKDGVEVLKEIGQEAQIIVISSIGQEEMIDKAYLYGAKSYVVKPFDNNQVKAEVSKILGS